MDEFHFLGEHNEFDDFFAKLEESLPLAVKLQRANGDTDGALEALTGIINEAISADTPPSSRASVSRAHVLEQAFDKARIIYKRANMPLEAVACGVVSYFMAIKRMSAGADFDAACATELRSPLYQQYFHRDEEDRAMDMELALDLENEAKEGLVKATASVTDVFILAEVTRLLTQMKIDSKLAQNILAAVSEPPNNPWEMFNTVMAALNH